MPNSRTTLGLLALSLFVLLCLCLFRWSRVDAPPSAADHPNPAYAESALDGPAPPVASTTTSTTARSPLDSVSTAAAASAPALQIELVDEVGAAVGNARVLLLDARANSQTSRTDANGRVGFLSHDGRGALFVRREREAPRREELDTSAGERRVQLRRMSELSGVVREKGTPPAGSIELRLYSDARLFSGIDLPKDVVRFLGLDEEGDRYEAVQATATDGTFAFRGLPATWSGGLILEGTWVVADEQREDFGERIVPTGAPTTGLVIAVERLPRIVGRIVDAAGNPAPKSNMMCLVTWSKGNSTGIGATTGADGRFEIGLRQSQFDDIALDVRGPEGTGLARLERTYTQIGPALDIGDIALARGSSLRLHVTDRDGRPIQGAVAVIQGASATPSTDAKGDCAIEDIPSEATLLRVLAKGRIGAHIPLPTQSADPLPIVLEPCNRLTIRIRGPNGEAPKGLRARLSAMSPVFPDAGSNAIDRVLRERHVGKWKYGAHDGGGRWTAVFEPNDEATLALEGVVAGVTLDLDITDVTDRVCAHASLAPLGISEMRDEEVKLLTAGHDIFGIVIDEKGAAVPAAEVNLLGERQSSIKLSDSDGRFRFESLFATDVDFSVRKDGFAWARVKKLPLTLPTVNVTVTLEHGRRVVVSVIDAKARPVTSGNLSAMDLEITTGWPAHSLGSGRYEVVDLPSHEIELRLRLAGRTYTLRHDPHVAEARIEVPVHGRLIVAWSTDATGRHAIELRSLDETIDAVRSPTSDKAFGESTFEDVLPGEYEVSLVLTDPTAGAAATKLPAQKITVEADATSRVTVRL